MDIISAEKRLLRKDLNEALKEMYESREAYLLEVVVENEENVFPMINNRRKRFQKYY